MSLSKPLSRLRILIIHHEPDKRSILEQRLREITDWDIEILAAADTATVFTTLKEHLIDVAFLEYSLPQAGGLKILEQIRQIHPRVAVVLTSNAGDERIAVEAMKKGARDYINHAHLPSADIRQILHHAVETQTLQTENADLRQVNRAKDDFVATVSHELRTPLAVILGYARALEENELGGLNDVQKKAVKAIKIRGQQLLQMVNRMLTFKETAFGTQQVVLQPTDFNVFLKNYLDTHWSAPPNNKRVRIEHRLQTQALWILADTQQLHEVLHSLMTNAVKFSPDGASITVSLEAREAREACLMVQDHGRGIPPEALPHLFEGFFHAEKALTRQVPGLGLGLALARQIIELHGGRIWLQSDGIGTGTTACISLPLVDPDTPKVVVDQPVRVQKKRILVVEDDPSTVEVIRLFLAGFSDNLKVEEAHDGEKALDLLQEEAFDLVVLDIKLPNMTGLDIIDAIRKLPHNKRIPILIVTGYQEAARRAVTRGAEDFLIKPFDRRVFLHKTLKLLGLERRSRSSDVLT